MPTPQTVEEGKTIRELPNGGWDSRIRVFECDKLVRAFVVSTRRLTVVIDTLLGPQAGRWLLSAALEGGGGGRPAPPLVVLNSHSDWDHYWGNQAFPVPIVGSYLSPRRVMESHGPRELVRKRQEDAASFAEVVPTPPSVLIEGRGSVDGGDLTFVLLPTPGHRPDHLAVWVPEIRTLFAGDAVEDPFPLLDDSEEVGLAQLQLTSLNTLMDLDPAWLMPCHAEPQRGSGLIRDNRAYVHRLLESGRHARSDQDLLELFPYPGPPESDFYRSEHVRNLAQARRDARSALTNAAIPGNLA
jgi:glyoxylase-like metal-dependent hydrolase (beta-lactamase superfamily II)